MVCGTFYFAGPNSDWTWPQNGSRWQDALKTLFDPCPAGWRVPLCGKGNRSPWADFALPGTKDANSPTGDPGTGITAGYQFYTTTSGVLTWYGFSGLRLATDPRMEFCGVVSRYHSASVQTETATYLLFLLRTEVLPSTSAMQAYGYPVRCIRE